MFQIVLVLLAGGFAAIAGGGSSSSSSDDDTANGDGAASGGPQPFAPTGGATPSPALTATPVSALAFSPAAAAPDPNAYALSWAGLTEEEQLVVELINRARIDPQAEVARLNEPLASGIPSAPAEPLAVTPELSAASRAHSQDMDDRNFFAHTNPSGETPGDRAVDAGHGEPYVGENIGWIASGSKPTGAAAQTRVEAHHENLWESDGHQKNLMNASHSEIGVGYDYGSQQGLNGSTHVTQMFGDRGINYLTGVVIKDGDADDFYDMGEGLGGVKVTADDGADTYTTSTWDAGGYTLALPPGSYHVTFEGGGLKSAYASNITIGDDNVKLDVIEDEGGAVALTSAAPVDPTTASATLAEMAVVETPEEGAMPLPEVPVEEVVLEENVEEEADLLLV
ncbi:CAP domain-containing protein [Tropicimonas sp. S265A]|uniref:CAP domain-containing protein n=1 Tax=Tropicimonas sp. S265A TaxID=3415134 RepID=UPI003C7D0EEC